MRTSLFSAAARVNYASSMSAQLTAQQASHAAAEARHEGELLSLDVNKLYLITQALWELLKREHGYNDELLMRKVLDIDLSSGRLDGKAPKKERPNCPSCGRKLGRLPTCLYCGAVALLDPFAR